jgi:sugar phosphate permease
MSVEAATISLALFGIGGLFGQCAGGLLGQALYNRNKRHPSYLMCASTLLGILPLLYVINGEVGGPAFYIASTLAGFLVSVTSPNVKSMLQNVCSPETRGTAFAFFNLTDDIGKGGGPVIVAALVSALQGKGQY